MKLNRPPSLRLLLISTDRPRTRRHLLSAKKQRFSSLRTSASPTSKFDHIDVYALMCPYCLYILRDHSLKCIYVCVMIYTSMPYKNQASNPFAFTVMASHALIYICILSLSRIRSSILKSVVQKQKHFRFLTCNDAEGMPGTKGAEPVFRTRLHVDVVNRGNHIKNLPHYRFVL